MFKFLKKEPPKSEFRQKVDENRQKHKSLKKTWDEIRLGAKLEQIGLQESHVDSKGNVFYTHTNILDIVFVRYMGMLEALQKIEFNLTLQEFKGILNNIRRAAKKGDEVTIYKECDDAEHRMTRLPQKRSILELAMTFIYLHDENPYTYNAVTQARKLDLITSDPELEVFFCERGWEIAKPYLPENSEGFNVSSVHDFLNKILEEKKKKDIG